MDRQDLTKLYVEAAERRLDGFTDAQRRAVARQFVADQIARELRVLSDQIAKITNNAIRVQVEQEKTLGDIVLTAHLPHCTLSERICVEGGSEDRGPGWKRKDAADDLNTLVSVFNPMTVMINGDKDTMLSYTPDTPARIAREYAERIFNAAAQTPRPADVARIFGPTLTLTGPERNEPLSVAPMTVREVGNGFNALKPV
jgi:hypothetical protein